MYKLWQKIYTVLAYQNKSNAEIAEFIGKSRWSVANKLNRMQLVRTEKQEAEVTHNSKHCFDLILNEFKTNPLAVVKELKQIAGLEKPSVFPVGNRPNLAEQRKALRVLDELIFDYNDFLPRERDEVGDIEKCIAEFREKMGIFYKYFSQKHYKGKGDVQMAALKILKYLKVDAIRNIALCRMCNKWLKNGHSHILEKMVSVMGKDAKQLQSSIALLCEEVTSKEYAKYLTKLKK